MRGNPFVDLCQPGGDGSGVKERARRVAEVGGSINEVHLRLQEPNSIIQLRSDGPVLVRGYIVGDDEGGVVGGDFGYVAILPGTELGIVVAWCFVRRLR